MDDDRAALLDINFAYLVITRDMILCPHLSGNELLLFGQIAALDSNSRGCFAQNGYFAAFLKLSKPTVSGLIKTLQEKGLIDVLRGRGPGGVEERQIFLSIEGNTIAGRKGVRAETSGERQSSTIRNSEGGGFGIPNQKVNILNTLPCALTREDLTDFQARVYAAAGEALASPAACPGTASLRDLLYLLNDLPTSPACTADEVIDAVTAIAKWYQSAHGPGSMKGWRLVEKKAREFRDKRLNGQPVKVVEPKPVEGLGDPAGFDDVQWQALVRLSNMRSGAWKDEWGPPPGTAGSYVPAGLVSEWRGAAESVKG